MKLTNAFTTNATAEFDLPNPLNPTEPLTNENGEAATIEFHAPHSAHAKKQFVSLARKMAATKGKKPKDIAKMSDEEALAVVDDVAKNGVELYSKLAIGWSNIDEEFTPETFVTIFSDPAWSFMFGEGGALTTWYNDASNFTKSASKN